jgi:hypothetical protein
MNLIALDFIPSSHVLCTRTGGLYIQSLVSCLLDEKKRWPIAISCPLHFYPPSSSSKLIGAKYKKDAYQRYIKDKDDISI